MAKKTDLCKVASSQDQNSERKYSISIAEDNTLPKIRMGFESEHLNDAEVTRLENRGYLQKFQSKASLGEELQLLDDVRQKTKLGSKIIKSITSKAKLRSWINYQSTNQLPQCPTLNHLD